MLLLFPATAGSAEQVRVVRLRPLICQEEHPTLLADLAALNRILDGGRHSNNGAAYELLDVGAGDGATLILPVVMNFVEHIERRRTVGKVVMRSR